MSKNVVAGSPILSLSNVAFEAMEQNNDIIKTLTLTDRQTQSQQRGVWWHGGRTLDSESRGPPFDPHSGCLVVSLSKITISSQSTA